MAMGRSRGSIGALAVRYGLLLVVAAVFVVPLLVMFVGSVKPDLDVLAESSSPKAFWPTRIENNYAGTCSPPASSDACW